MKRFRDSDYWVTEDGKVFRYWPEWKKQWVLPQWNNPNKTYVKTRIIPERYTPMKTQYNRGNDRPYVHLSLETNNHQSFLIYRLVAELYVPGYFEGAEVDHIDCNIHNNHSSNLQWCTPEYNRQKGNNPDYPLFTSSAKSDSK